MQRSTAEHGLRSELHCRAVELAGVSQGPSTGAHDMFVSGTKAMLLLQVGPAKQQSCFRSAEAVQGGVQPTRTAATVCLSLTFSQSLDVVGGSR